MGEVYLLGGAVMCLAFKARPSTKDVDAYFVPAIEVREAAARVAADAGVTTDWLNDAAKGFLSEHGTFDPYLDLPNLKLFTATAEYLLAMKCLSMRLGAESQDESDVRFLLRYLNIKTQDDALAIIHAFYPPARFPQKTLYVLEDLLA